MAKITRALLIFLIAVFVLACKSAPETPEETPEGVVETTKEEPEEIPKEEPKEVVKEEPKEVPKEEPKEVVEKPTPVDQRDIQSARNAIARAREADADYYDPENLASAETSLRKALSLKDSDPDQARQNLAQSKKKANLAFENSINKAAQMLAERGERLINRLQAIEAHNFLPAEYKQAVAGIDEAERLFRGGDYVASREMAYAALEAMANLNDRLSEHLRWMDILKRDINQYLQEAEDIGAYERAPQQFARVNELYMMGIEAFQNYQLYESEEYLGSAREAALEAIKIAKGKREEEKKLARALMLDVMKELEEASALTIVTEDGTVVAPEAWTGEDFLSDEAKEEPRSKGPGGNYQLPSRLPGQDEIVVLGTVAEENLLVQAKELWQQGVAEWDDGNFRLAEEYFREARILINAYKTQAVNEDTPVYVVRLIPERRDCLWRIAEYDSIYGNPYLWPRIWRRNRKLIQHPDLISPGWKLAIPPE